MPVPLLLTEEEADIVTEALHAKMRETTIVLENADRLLPEQRQRLEIELGAILFMLEMLGGHADMSELEASLHDPIVCGGQEQIDDPAEERVEITARISRWLKQARRGSRPGSRPGAP